MPEYSIVDLFNMVEQATLPELEETDKYAKLTDEEIKRIDQKLMHIAENEEVFSVLWAARNSIYDAVRAVKKRVLTDFVGFGAEGDDLDLDLIAPDDVKKSGTPLTTFEQSVTAGTTYFWSDTGDAKITLDEDEAIVIAGWYDPVDSPRAVRIKAELPKKNILINTPFYMNKDVPVIIHEPITVKPKDSFDIQVRYNSEGIDRLMPIGVYIRKASARSL